MRNQIRRACSAVRNFFSRLSCTANVLMANTQSIEIPKVGTGFDFKAMVYNLLGVREADDQKATEMINERYRKAMAAEPDADDTKAANELTVANEKATKAEQKVTKLESDFANERTTLQGKVTTAEAAATAANTAKVTAETNFANERKERIKLMLDTAVTEKRITKAERDGFETQMANEATFAGAVEALGKKSAALPGGQIGAGALGGRQTNVNPNQAKAREAFLEDVHKTMANEKLSYDAAFQKCQKKDEHAPYFANAKQPADTTK